MVNLDAIYNRARADLVISTEHGEPDVFLWEHSVRVAQSARRIAELLVPQGHTADLAAVVGAGLYHDAGWAVRFATEDVKRLEILTRPPPESHREQGAALLEKSLAGLLPDDSLERAALAIRSLNHREISLLEAQIVLEAENLDEFGVISLWPTVRRGAADGKGVKAVIDTWRRRKEYQFWNARLKDSFRFPVVREIATARLSKLERLMQELEEQQLGEDIVAPSGVASTSIRPVPST